MLVGSFLLLYHEAHAFLALRAASERADGILLFAFVNKVSSHFFHTAFTTVPLLCSFDIVIVMEFLL